MRFLVFSDVHLHLWKLGDPLLRLKDQIRLLKQMSDYALENKINTILFSGDLFHTHGNLRSEVISEACEIFREISFRGQTVVGISGNHDLADREGKYTSLCPIAITLIDNNGQWEDEILICGITYTEDRLKLQEQLNKLPKSPHVLLLHQGVSGVEINSKGFTLNEILTVDMLHESTMIAFSGHYHSHKQIGKLIIPGALCQHNFGDVDDDSRGFLDVTYSDNKWNIKQIKSPEFFKLFTYINTNKLIEDLKSFNTNWQTFARIQKVPHNKALEIKEALLDENILTNVQLIFNEEEIKRVELMEPPSIVNIFKEFIDSQELSERRKEIGNQLITGNYKLP